MTKLQNRQLSMYLAVVRFCQANSTLVLLNPAFARAAQKLESQVAALQSSVKGQLQRTGSGAKTAQRQRLVEGAAIVAGIVSGWANDHSDADMEQRNAWSAGTLEKLAENKLPEVAALILEDSRTVLTRDSECGLGEDMLTGLEAAIGAFREGKDKPRKATTERSTQTQKIARLVSETTELLKKRMDKYVLSYKKTHPDFYTEYKEARKLIDPATAGRKEQPMQNA